MIRHVIFDWNGTLLDDFALALATVNALRVEHRLAPISRDDYRRAFQFPIAQFYRTIGFGHDDLGLRQVMASYVSRFNAAVDECPLHPGARELLGALRAAGVGVHVLSASYHHTLISNLRAKQLDDLFDHVAGLGDHLATTKLQLGAELAARLAAPPGSVVYVGDTDHDYEVAAAQGWKFLFVDHGHQAAIATAPHCQHPIAQLSEILDLIQGPT